MSAARGPRPVHPPQGDPVPSSPSGRPAHEEAHAYGSFTRSSCARAAAVPALALIVMAGGTAGALVAPWQVAVALLFASLLALRRGRGALLLFAALAAAFQAILFGLLVGHGDALAIGPLTVYPTGAALGLVGAFRLTAVLGVNLAVLGRVPAPRILDGIPLPLQVRAFLGAVLIAVQDLQDEGRRLLTARQLEGVWPGKRMAQIRAAAAMVPAVLVAAERRGAVRHDALRSAGIAVSRSFAPLVAVTALALAGRLVFAPVPNITPTYLFVFLGGALFGARVGALSGAIAMALSNLLLSGLLLPAYVNVPAMASLGLLGGLTARWVHGPPLPTAIMAGALGMSATLLFSVLSDVATWALVPEYSTTPGTLPILVLAGLAFNAVPAVANALLFAWTVGPVASAHAALHAGR